MQQFLVPVLLLATAALSTSNVLPMLSIHQTDTPLGLNSHYYDNIISYKIQKKNNFNKIFCKETKTTSENRILNLCKVLQSQYAVVDNNRAEANDDIFDKGDNYNGEGYRKEQWHNYPRQLDRLQNDLREFIRIDNKQRLNSENGKSKDYSDEIGIEDRNKNIVSDTSNEFVLDSNKNIYNIDDSVSTDSNPLLIHKIRFALLSHNLQRNDGSSSLIMDGLLSNMENEKDEVNPEINNIIKVKREDIPSQDDEYSEPIRGDEKIVQKRLFSLWSRLQNLSHKGHELQHRRHLHAFYGLPDSDGNGVLTAETRAAALMRPPGSPLRWG